MIAYLELHEVVEFHGDLMSRTGSPPCPLLHPDKLDGALNRPRHFAHYEGADLIRQAAILARAISQAQAFEQGNKRAAFAAADTFLVINGHEFEGDPIRFGCYLNFIAEPPEGFTREHFENLFDDWFRKWIRPLPAQAD